MEDNTTTTTEPTSMMNKKPEDLTVGEALKINLGALAIIAAVPVAFVGAVAGFETLSEKFKSWKARRQEAKENQTEETEEPVSE